VAHFVSGVFSSAAVKLGKRPRQDPPAKNNVERLLLLDLELLFKCLKSAGSVNSQLSP
jgi:hypothetical protein